MAKSQFPIKFQAPTIKMFWDFWLWDFIGNLIFGLGIWRRAFGIRNLYLYPRDKKIPQFPGFTLLELLLVIGILAIMGGALLSNVSAGQATLAAHRSTQLIAEALREAENNALGAKATPGSSSSPLGGWGVHFSANSAPLLFADVDGNHQYDSGTDVLVRTIALDQNAPITAISGGANNLDIVFLPPNPNVYINGLATTFSTPDATVTVTGTYGNVVVKIIHINAIGALSVQ